LIPSSSKVSATFNSEMIAGKRATQNANIQGKQGERTTKDGCENLTTYYLITLCQSQSLAVRPVTPWQNASRSRGVAKCCERTPRGATYCQQNVQSGSAIWAK